MNAESMETTRDRTGFAKLAAVALALLCALAAGGLAGCTSDGSSSSSSNSTVTQDMGSTDVEVDEYEIEPNTFFDQDGLTLTATEALTIDDKAYLLVTAVNNSGQDLLISDLNSYAVGNSETDCTLYIEIEDGQTVENSKMYFVNIGSGEDLFIGISGNIQVCDLESGDTLYDAELDFTIEAPSDAESGSAEE